MKDSDYRDATIRPDYVFQFVGFSEQDPLSGLDTGACTMGQSSFWRADDYWPEPLSAGRQRVQYKFIDSILVKVPVEIWVDKVLPTEPIRQERAKNIQNRLENKRRRLVAGLKTSNF